MNYRAYFFVIFSQLRAHYPKTIAKKSKDESKPSHSDSVLSKPVHSESV